MSKTPDEMTADDILDVLEWLIEQEWFVMEAKEQYQPHTERVSEKSEFLMYFSRFKKSFRVTVEEVT